MKNAPVRIVADDSSKGLKNTFSGGFCQAAGYWIVKWGHWDLNPDQRVSTGQGATLSELYGSTLQSVITGSANPFAIIPV